MMATRSRSVKGEGGWERLVTCDALMVLCHKTRSKRRGMACYFVWFWEMRGIRFLVLELGYGNQTSRKSYDLLGKDF
jgi:hypothetical protein